MKCPACKSKLNRVQYEGIHIHQCSACFGHLVKFERLKTIEVRREKTEEALMDEMVQSGEDTAEKIRCTRCLSNMEKRKKKIGPWDFFIDRCNRCKLTWLDAGELAKWQVIYQFSEKGEEAERFRQRLENMTPAEKAEYEERIANLPEENVSLEIFAALATNWQFGRYHHFDLF